MIEDTFYEQSTCGLARHGESLSCREVPFRLAAGEFILVLTPPRVR